MDGLREADPRMNRLGKGDAWMGEALQVDLLKACQPIYSQL